MRYLPLTPDDRTAMLAAIGAKSIDDLFVDVPEAARLDGPVDLPRVAGEMEVERALSGDPETVNADAEGEGWFAKIKVSDASQIEGLMDRAAYDAFLATL